jgi:hypothetical protein
MKNGQLSEADVLLPVAATDDEFFRKFFLKMRALPSVEQKMKLIDEFAKDVSHSPYSVAVKSVLLSEGPMMGRKDIQALLNSGYYFATYWLIRHKELFHKWTYEPAKNIKDDEKFGALLCWAYDYHKNNVAAPLHETFVSEAKKIGISKRYFREVLKEWNKKIEKFSNTIVVGTGKKGFWEFLSALQGEVGKKICWYLKKDLTVVGPPSKLEKVPAQKVPKPPAEIKAKIKKETPKKPQQSQQQINTSLFMPLLNYLFSRPSEWWTPRAEVLRKKLVDSVEKLNEKDREYLKSLSEGAFPVLVVDSERAREMSAFAALLLKNAEPEEIAATPHVKLKHHAARQWFEKRDPHSIRTWLEDAGNRQVSDPLLLKYAVHFLLRKTFWNSCTGVKQWFANPFVDVIHAIGMLSFVLKTCQDRLGPDAGTAVVLDALETEEKVVQRHFRSLVNMLRDAVPKRMTLSGTLAGAKGIRQLDEELDTAFAGKFPLRGVLEDTANTLEKAALNSLQALVRVLDAHVKDLSSRPPLPPGCPAPQLFSAEDFLGLLDRAWPAVLRSWREKKRDLPAEGILVPVLSRLLTAHGFLGLSLRESPKGELRCRWFLRQGKSFAMRFTPGRRTKRNTSTDVLMEILSLYALAAAADACNRFLPLSRRARPPKKTREIEWTVDIAVLPAPVSAPDEQSVGNIRVKIATRYPRSQSSRPRSRPVNDTPGKGSRSASSYPEAGHLRRLLPGQKSSPKAAENALIFGGLPYLPPGYTFEKPHWVNKNGGPTEVKFFVPTIHSAALAVSLDAIAVQAALKSGVDLCAYGFEPAAARPGSRLKAMMRFAGDPIDAAELLRN